MNLSNPRESGVRTIAQRHLRLAPDVVLNNAHVMQLLLAALIWLGAIVRLPGLFDAGMHADEALFASYARAIAVWRDPLLVLPVVDKPPLLFYLQALFFPMMGSAESWVARLPNLMASLLAIPLSARLVWLLYRDRLATVIAALFMAFSPLAVQFSPSAFTDPLLSCLLLAALVAVAGAAGTGGHGAVAGGLLFGLGAATKHQAWLFLPLIVSLIWLRRWSSHQIARWAGGAALPLLALVAWDLARSGRLSLWSLQMQSYGGLRPAWSWELWPRLEAWAQQWELVWGSPILVFFLILGLPLFLALLISEQDWPTAYDQLFVIFAGALVLLLWVVAVPVWERYLLPQVPLVALLLGRFVSRALSFLAPDLPLTLRQLQAGALLLLFLLLAPVAYETGREIAAGSPGEGAAQVADRLRDEPDGVVLYDHWYSWQWRYYLFDSGVYVSWFPHPAALVEDLQAFGHLGPARYVVLPVGDQARPVLRAISGAGFSLQRIFEAEGVSLYRLSAEPQGGAAGSQ
ncbi:MAG TPA: glycosyltransferase family 39 protein [Candidatus Sulfomarinibacteraceae bacterium]|nr:glycosyltransferase family 39 protein [Candidatus Sulfomarinibacteraceae bacterium]